MKRSHAKATSTKTFKKKKSTGDYQKGREMVKQPKQELKAFDTNAINAQFNTAGAFNALNLPVNGAELYQRVGRKIYMKSLHVRGILQQNNTNVQDIGRMLIVYDSQPNAATFGISSLLKDANAGAGTNCLSEINLDNRERFKILRDTQFLLPAVTLTAGVQTNLGMVDEVKQSFNIDMFIKLKGLETVFNAVNGGTIADITSGSLFMVTVSLNQNNGWEFLGSTRLRYYD